MTNVLLILQLLYNIYGEDIYSVTIKGTLITVNLDIDILPKPFKLSNVDVVFINLYHSPINKQNSS